GSVRNQNPTFASIKQLTLTELGADLRFNQTCPNLPPILLARDPLLEPIGVITKLVLFL
ncbi:hypothetical protein LINGRAHAP2_LOCUS31237, partial [Linum grandiflorum]